MRDEHVAALLPLLEARYGAVTGGAQYVARVLDALDGRVSTRAQFLDTAASFFVEPDLQSSDARAFAQEAWNATAASFVRAFRSSLASSISAADWSTAHDSIEAALLATAAATELPVDAARKALRFVVTGARVGAGIVPTLVVLGRDTVLRRLNFEERGL